VAIGDEGISSGTEKGKLGVARVSMPYQPPFLKGFRKSNEYTLLDPPERDHDNGLPTYQRYYNGNCICRGMGTPRGGSNVMLRRCGDGLLRASSLRSSNSRKDLTSGALVIRVLVFIVPPTSLVERSSVGGGGEGLGFLLRALCFEGFGLPLLVVCFEVLLLRSAEGGRERGEGGRAEAARPTEPRISTVLASRPPAVRVLASRRALGWEESARWVGFDLVLAGARFALDVIMVAGTVPTGTEPLGRRMRVRDLWTAACTA
jgi:hypothetical protein